MVSVIAVILFAIILVATFTTSRSYAEALDSAHENESARNATTRGIYTSLSISINGGGRAYVSSGNRIRKIFGRRGVYCRPDCNLVFLLD